MPDDQIWNFSVTIDHERAGHGHRGLLREGARPREGRHRPREHAYARSRRRGVREGGRRARRRSRDLTSHRGAGDATSSTRRSHCRSRAPKPCGCTWRRCRRRRSPTSRTTPASTRSGSRTRSRGRSTSRSPSRPKALADARAFSPWLPLSDPRTATYQEQYRAEQQRRDARRSRPHRLGHRPDHRRRTTTGRSGARSELVPRRDAASPVRSRRLGAARLRRRRTRGREPGRGARRGGRPSGSSSTTSPSGF